MRAGAAEAVITPEVGVRLLGPVRRSTGVNDDLFARALVLNDGEMAIALVCLDLVGLDLSHSDEIRAAVTARTGIRTVLLNCSHTHSAPFTIPWGKLWWDEFQAEGKVWHERLRDTVAEVVSQAANSGREVGLRVGRAPVSVGVNRRLVVDGECVMALNPDGPVAPWVDVLRVDGADGVPAAVLLSHAAHPVIVHESSSEISADYPGYATAAVRERLGDDTVALFAQGCGADINGEPLRGGIEAAMEAGARLGDAVMDAAESSESVGKPRVAVVTETLQLELQDPPRREEVEAALGSLEERAKSEDDQLGWLRNRILCVQDLLTKVRQGERRTLRFEVNAVGLGSDLCLLAMPHEVFAEYQLWAVKESPFRHTIVWGYTNGCESYVPTEAAFSVGGYEAAPYGAALYYPYRLPLEPTVEGQIKDAVRQLWKRFVV